MFKKIMAVAVCVATVMNVASADIIHGIDMDFVTIGHAGNLGDTRAEAYPYGCGAVGYNYRIGKNEVTNAQWNAFIAVAGAPTGNPSGAYDTGAFFTGAQQPANCVSWYEAAQFCNYLTSGNKSLGAYQFGTNGSITVDRASAILAFGTTYVIPTEDEWYKAAYFKPDASGYSLYANGTDTAPVAGVQSNYGPYNAPWNVGSGIQEQNGTYDMMGNVWEWNETFIYVSYLGIRGGSYYGDPDFVLRSSWQYGDHPDLEAQNLGFRVASIPEPCTLILLALGGLAAARRQR
jgi:formylglycine-generating enzyme